MNRTNTEALVQRRLRQLETMLRIRYFEERIEHMVTRGQLGGTCHVCTGQEAVAVGVIDQLQPIDKVVSSHRGHGHLIAKGGDLKRIFAELMEREIGYCRGRGGTQHLCAVDIGFYGTNGITAGGIPIAVGIALAAKRDSDGSVVVSFFGDGAINQGACHEALNMAAIWDVPAIFVCENNLYAMSTHISQTSKIQDLAVRAESYGMLAMIADGTDIADLEGKAEQALEHARSGGGPVFLEAKTYRHRGHSKSDNRAYRTREEERRWLDKDCVERLKAFLAEIGYAAEASATDARARADVEAAEAAAAAADFVDGHDVALGVRA